MIMHLKTSKLLPARTILRPVLKQSLEFAELVESIRYNLETTGNGLINSICVCKHPTREGYYEIIDGMWRFEAYKFLDIPEIDAILKEDVTDENFLAIQIQANSVSYETRPIEFAEQMQTMIKMRESIGAPINILELAQLVGHGSKWVSDRLKLLDLSKDNKDRLRNGELKLGKAVALSRIKDPNLQNKVYEKYKKLNTRDFELKIGKILAEQNNDVQLFKNSALRPRLQSMDSLVDELDTLRTMGELIARSGAEKPIDGARLALEWVLNLHDKGREKRVKESLKNKKLRWKDRIDVIRRQRYEELNELESEFKNF